ncbi:MAG TPA: RdgB/HAM1 family non-canonical purine NTP pyrophosphatase [Thermoleophilaceae bacterium]|nr:RdgB/HAM1 family non-canonical purine NTP pyrophosphatase [Thermoleophilaceae bacterium]
MKLVLATRNEHKLREFREALPGIEILPLPGDVELPPETGETFADNAVEKARAAHEATGLPAIADDSGIEAVALGGRPGVRSARYAGETASDEENLQKLLDEVGAANGDRSVAYVCALVHVTDDGEEWLFENRCTGQLAGEPRGEGGFGYDPAFIPDDYDDGRTMAELSPEQKHAISHRGRAAKAFRDWLEGQQ